MDKSAKGCLLPQTDAAFDELRTICRCAYSDAKAHGLYDDDTLSLESHSVEYVRKRLTLLIREEVCELWDAFKDPAHFAEELADVVIMCMSAAGHLGIDLAAEVKRKMEINQGRPYGHKTA